MKKLKNIKIAFVDIDGTLSNSERKISLETTEAVKSAKGKGLIVVLSSGRNNRYVCNASKNANASNYIIACNGAEIFDYENNISIKTNKISEDKIKVIWEFCEENNIGCILNSRNNRFCNKNYFIEEEDKILIDNITNINEDIFQMVTFGYEYEKMQELEKLINSINLNIANPSQSYLEKNCLNHHFFFDVTNNYISKGKAIKELLEYLNLKKENAIGFGDHINDFDLFDAVGFKIAMGNANSKLKEKADFITLSNDEHGVAYFLNNFIDYGDNIYEEK